MTPRKKPNCPKCGKLVGSAEMVPGYPILAASGKAPKYETDYLLLPCRCVAKPDEPQREAVLAVYVVACPNNR